MKSSAEQLFELGQKYALGEGLVKDEKKAVELYQQAANQGYAKAQHNLGVCYENGKGVAKDEKKAAELYQQATKIKEQQILLQKEVDELHQKAEKLGNAEAQYQLGHCYGYG